MTNSVHENWISGKMRRVRIAKPGEIELVEDKIPGPLAGHALVKVERVGICGSDMSFVKGSSYYIAEGLNSYPVAFGHEVSGTIVCVGDGVTNVAPGDRVLVESFIACGRCEQCRRNQREVCSDKVELGLTGLDGGAADYLRIPAGSCFKLAPSMSFREGALVEPIVPILHAFDRANIRPDTRVGVVGTGTLGLMGIQLAAKMGLHVDAIGIDEHGLALAKELGAAHAIRPDDVAESSYDVLIEASGSARAFSNFLKWTAPGGKILVVGIVNEAVPDFVPSHLVFKSIEITGIMDGIHHYTRTINLIEQKVLTPDILVDKVYAPEDCVAAFARISKGETRRPKVMFDFTIGRE